MTADSALIIDDIASTLTPAQASDLLAHARARLDKYRMEASLAEFTRGAWHVLEPGRDLVWNWHLDVVCAYLEAVVRREIRRLIIMVPPGSLKSILVSVMCPSWIWTRRPEERFLCGSNESTLATRDAVKMRQLVTSEWYRSYWPISISDDQSEKTLFANTSKGHRESQGILGRVTGKRGSYLIVDDPHDAKQVESDTQRKAVIDAWDTAWSTRLDDPNSSPIVVIMQRLHDKDLAAHLMAKAEQKWVRLAIPMRYDPQLTYSAAKDLGRPDLDDPRRREGELLFPARFNEETVRGLEIDLGPYGTAAQLQQRPSPKGGGELQRKWLCFYKMPPRGGNRAIIVDPAGERKPGQKGGRDNTAMGVIEFCDDQNYYLVDAYRDRLNLTERTDILFKWHRHYKPLFVGYESYGMQADIVHIRDRMERESYRFRITELGGSLRKEERIRRLNPLLEAGRIWFPETLHRTLADGRTVDIIDRMIEEEYLPFPVGGRDDFLDMLSRICDPDFKLDASKPRPALRVRERIIHDRIVGY